MESVLGQSLKPKEIIVVNDGSTDGSARVMDGMLLRHPELVFWSQPNQGAHQAINSGIHRATGDLVAILNSDDCYHARRLEQCAKVLADAPEISAVTTALSFMDGAGNKIKNPWYDQSRAFFDEVGDLPLALMNGNFIMTTSNLVIRRSVFQEIGYFAPLRYAHDLDFFLRLLVNGKRIHVMDEPLLSYRMHAQNTILEEHANVRVEWAFACARFITTVWGRPEWKEKGWPYMETFSRIMERHSLSRLLNMFFVYFMSRYSAGGDLARFDEDPEFLHSIRQVAR